MVNADGKISDEELVLGFQRINMVKGNRERNLKSNRIFMRKDEGFLGREWHA